MIIKQIGEEVWWAYRVVTRGDVTEFVGSAFQGANAERLAREWATVTE